jgi:hypothetical protein
MSSGVEVWHPCRTLLLTTWYQRRVDPSNPPPLHPHPQRHQQPLHRHHQPSSRPPRCIRPWLTKSQASLTLSGCCRPCPPMWRASRRRRPRRRKPTAVPTAITTPIGRPGSRSWIFPDMTGRQIRCCSSIVVNPIFASSAPCRRRRYGWPLTTWRTLPSSGLCSSKKMKARLLGGDSRSFSTCDSGQPCVRCRCSSSSNVAVQGPSRSTPTGSRRSSHAQAALIKSKGCSSTLAAYYLRSATRCASTHRHH